jgi:hypothetical protein
MNLVHPIVLPTFTQQAVNVTRLGARRMGISGKAFRKRLKAARRFERAQLSNP